jgi:predicted enzyme related to lactoylglutathione lyase
MTSRLHTVTVDCADPVALARFWAAVTGFTPHPDNDAEEALITAGGGATEMLFQRVPEGKTVKNRLHLDLRPSDLSRDEEVERLLSLGATLVLDMRQPDGTGWAQLADPEGNEFCVCRSDPERAATNA